MAETAQPQFLVRGINLAGAPDTAKVKKTKVEGLVKRTSFIVLGVYLLALASLFGTNFFFAARLSTLARTGETLKSQIKALSQTETLLQTVKNRTDLASSAIDTSPQAPDRLLAQVSTMLPPGGQIAEVTAQKDKFNVSVTLPDSQTLSVFLKNVTTSQFSSIELQSLTLNTTGNYTVAVQIK